MNKNSLIKKIAASSLAILMAIGALGVTSTNSNITLTYADNSQTEYEQQLSDLSKQQKALEAKINSADNDIKNQQQKLDDIVAQMNNISEQITTSEKYSKQIEDEMVKIDSQARDSRYQLQIMEDKIKSNVNDFMKRVRAMYINGSDSYISIIADSADFYDILMRTELISRVAKHDNDTINSLIEMKNKIDQQQKKLDAQQNKLKEKALDYSEQKENLSKKLADLSELKDTYGDSLAKLSEEKDSYQNNYDAVLEKYNAQIAAQKPAQNTAKKTTSVSNTQSAATKAKTSANTVSTTKANTVSTTNKSSSNNKSTTGRKTTTAKQTTPAKTTTPKMTTAKKTTNRPAQTTTTSSKNNNSGSTSVPNASKVDIVLNYARSMVGGSYVWGGSSFRATDCSGLVMQCYAQVGINLPHYAASQAEYGRYVSYSNIMPGDLVFFGGSSNSSIYHVGIYAGNGNMIHAESTNTGIVISNLESFKTYNNITCIKRLL